MVDDKIPGELQIPLSVTGEHSWLHFDVNDTHRARWLQERSGVDPLMIEAMLTPSVRPKLYVREETLLLILRAADTHDVNEHDELRSIRIYCDGKRIISTSSQPLPVVENLMSKWRDRYESTADTIKIFIDIIVHSVRGLEVILEDLDEHTDNLEQQVIGDDEDPAEQEIALLALQGLHLRRHLAPQREVLSRLANSTILWLGDAEKKRIREVQERVWRQLDETEVVRDRARIIREQRNGHVAEQVNQRLYIFSVVAVLFLPLGFLTGLLGVNLGGIPGAESPIGFAVFCGMLIALTGLIVVLFNRLKWL